VRQPGVWSDDCGGLWMRIWTGSRHVCGRGGVLQQG
jgi:hypothetical protein